MVDGEWTTDHTAPQETDGQSNINNVLLPEQIPGSSSSSNKPNAAIMSGVEPQSHTTALAKDVPKEESPELDSSDRSEPPGAFPMTPAHEPSRFAVPENLTKSNQDELPSSEKDQDLTAPSNAVPSVTHEGTTRTEDPQQTFGISPLPATSGIGNPINLQAGEKVPHPSSFTQNTVNTAITTDKDSYEKGTGAPQLPDVVTPQSERDMRGGGMFNLPGISGAMIPESSLPIGDSLSKEIADPDVTIQSTGPNATTAALAGNVPLEPRGVPEVIPKNQPSEKSDQERNPDVTIQSAGPSSTTAALAGSVPLEPRGVPQVIPEKQQEPGTSYEGRDPGVTIQSAGAGSTIAALAGKVPLEPRGTAQVVPKNQQMGDPYEGRDPGVTIQSAGPNSTTAALAGNVPLEPRGVPPIVQESQQQAGFKPEASANEEAVREKTEVEKELESKVPEEPATSEGTGGRNIGQAASGVAVADGFTPKGKATGDDASLPSRGLPTSVQQSIDDINKGTPIAPTVPDVVQKSIAQAHQSPEAAGSESMVDEKTAVERELLKEVKTKNAIGEPAPSSSAALVDRAPSATKDVPTAVTSAPTVGDVAAANATPAATDGKSSLSGIADADSRQAALAPRSAMAEAVSKRNDSRDISPMSHPITGSQAGPSVTTGVGTSSAPPVSAPQKPTAPAAPVTSASSASRPLQASSEASASSEKKSKRASGFFGKLRSKFSDKDKK